MSRIHCGIIVSLALLSLAARADAPAKPAEAWMKIDPAVAISAPGRTVTFTVDHGGLAGVGTTIPVFVLGPPEGTGIMTNMLSPQRLLITLALPANAPRGHRAIKVFLGNAPPASVSQEAVLHIGE